MYNFAYYPCIVSIDDSIFPPCRNAVFILIAIIGKIPYYSQSGAVQRFPAISNYMYDFEN